MNDTLPESLKSKRTKSYSDLFDQHYSSSYIEEPKKANSKLLSVFDEPNDYFDKKPTREFKTSKVRTSSFYSDRQPVLIDTASSIKAPTDSHLLITKSLHADLLVNKKPYNDMSSILTSKKPPSTINGFLYNGLLLINGSICYKKLKKTINFQRLFYEVFYNWKLNSLTEISPPRNFQIEKMEGRKKLLFCWEPPLEPPSNSPVVGYEVPSFLYTYLKMEILNYSTISF